MNRLSALDFDVMFKYEIITDISDEKGQLSKFRIIIAHLSSRRASAHKVSIERRLEKRVLASKFACAISAHFFFFCLI
jgi:hypothetical protein